MLQSLLGIIIDKKEIWLFLCLLTFMLFVVVRESNPPSADSMTLPPTNVIRSPTVEAITPSAIITPTVETITPAIEPMTPSPTTTLQKAWFREVSEEAGIAYQGESWGASWGDVNADGYPDLWVSNHTFLPSLYFNQGDGTFLDVARQFWPTFMNVDTHAALWVDFDNDGDQDIFQKVGGGAGVGKGPNLLFVNDEDTLEEQAVALGLDYALGRGRTALFFDWNQDSLLDVLVVNEERPDGQAPPALFEQTNEGFQNVSDLAFEQKIGRAEQAQLADLSGDGIMDLFLQMTGGSGSEVFPFRVFAGGPRSLTDLTSNLKLPLISFVSDLSIADFNGDLLPDIFVVTGSKRESDVQLVNSRRVEAYLDFTRGDKKGQGFKLNSRGDLTIYLHPDSNRNPIGGIDLSQVYIGANGHHPTEFPITLSALDPSVQGIKNYSSEIDAGIYIGYDATLQDWQIVNHLPRQVRVIAETLKPIYLVEPIGFQEYDERQHNKFLLNIGGEFEDETVEAGLDRANSCHSVASGDFDNDMDLDLYFVCARPSANSANVLYENQGDGTFRPVPGAGGAEGTPLGRAETVSVADYDLDGFLDLYVTNGGPYLFGDKEGSGPDEVYQNVGNDNHWLELDLLGTISNRDGIGVRVILIAGGISQLREQGGGVHGSAQNFKRLHFGLGQNEAVDKLIVSWPSGIKQEICDIAADQILQVVEPNRSSSDCRSVKLLR